MSSSAASSDASGKRAADRDRRAELAHFLRSRRARISPERVGLLASSNRRTPGLRRQEVADRAGLGISWYTWLEQGRAISPSAHALDSIARALLLDEDERLHLFMLAGVADHESAPDSRHVTVEARAVLERLLPAPSFVQNARYDILAYNRTYGRLIIDLDSVAVEDRNLLWLTLTNSDWQRVVVDWQDSARHMVANLRHLLGDNVGNPIWAALIDRLSSASEYFVELWARHDVRGVERITNKRKTFDNACVGRLEFQTVNFWLGPRPGLRLLSYLPIDATTDSRLALLAAG